MNSLCGLANLQAAIFDELTPIYPDTCSADGFSEYTVAGCNGTAVGAHIVLNGLTPGLPVTVKVEGSHRCFKLFELLAVPVEVNCGAKLRTEYLKDDINEFVIRRAPFMVYEALDPFYNIFTPPYANAAIAFKTPIEYCRQCRIEKWEITIEQGDASVTLLLNVREYPFDVPKANRDTFKYVNWFDFDRLAMDFRCEKWSDPYFKALEQYLRAAVFSRQNTFCINAAEIFGQAHDGNPLLDAARLDRIIATAKRAGISLFHGGALAFRKAYMNEDEVYESMDHGAVVHPEEIAQEFKRQAFDVFDNWPEAHAAVTGQAIPGEDGEAAILSMAKQLYGYIEKAGLADVWHQCCLDEPNTALEPAYRRICEIVRSGMPGIPILEPTLEGEPLAGTMDVWCPSLDQYERDIDFYNGRVAEGDRIWVYSCLTPAGNYCNRLLDMERLRAVWIGWAPMVYPDIEGFLHWGANSSSTGEPFRRQAGNFTENVLEFHPKHSMFLPAGDCAIFFPGVDGPMISTRSEAHRIGFEDFHILSMLKEKSPQDVLPLVNKVFRRFNDFEKDTAVYRATRQELLDMLARCTG